MADSDSEVDEAQQTESAGQARAVDPEHDGDGPGEAEVEPGADVEATVAEPVFRPGSRRDDAAVEGVAAPVAPGEGDPEVRAGDDADDPRRFFDRRRPWLRPITPRDRRRRMASVYWAVVYVLLMAGIASVVSFVAVRGYLLAAPSPTATGNDIANAVVPWVVAVVYVLFAAYVTRNWRRTLEYAVLFLSPVIVVLFISRLTSVAAWLVSWIPGKSTVYVFALLLPFVAILLLGRDFVHWQLWVEYPDDTCWSCGSGIEDERWAHCPHCGNDLQEQRLASLEGDADNADEVTVTPKRSPRRRGRRARTDEVPAEGPATAGEPAGERPTAPVSS